MGLILSVLLLPSHLHMPLPTHWVTRCAIRTASLWPGDREVTNYNVGQILGPFVHRCWVTICNHTWLWASLSSRAATLRKLWCQVEFHASLERIACVGVSDQIGASRHALQACMHQQSELCCSPWFHSIAQFSGSCGRRYQLQLLKQSQLVVFVSCVLTPGNYVTFSFALSLDSQFFIDPKCIASALARKYSTSCTSSSSQTWRSLISSAWGVAWIHAAVAYHLRDLLLFPTPCPMAIHKTTGPPIPRPLRSFGLFKLK